MLQGQGDKNYGFKIIILLSSTIVGILAIWWAAGRQESVDWISAQIIHQPSGYAVSQTEDGLTIVSNVFKDFEITLPKGFKVIEGKDPSFYFQDQDESTCLIKSDIINYKEQVNVDILKQRDVSLVETMAGGFKALKKEQTTGRGDFIYELQIPQNYFVIRYSLLADNANKDRCRDYFEQIKRSFISF